MSLVSKLLELQDAEEELEMLKKELDRDRASLGPSRELAGSKKKLEEVESSYQQLTDKQQSLEWESDDTKNKLNQVNEKLYSGRVTNPKELSNLQHEAELLSAHIRKTDEEAIEVMEQAERLEKDLNEARQNYSMVESQWQANQKDLQARIKTIEARLPDLKKHRDDLAGEIDPENMRVYERLKQQRGSAVARVSQGTCGGCRISLSSAQLQRARGVNLEKCANCGRILACE